MTAFDQIRVIESASSFCLTSFAQDRVLEALILLKHSERTKCDPKGNYMDVL